MSYLQTKKPTLIIVMGVSGCGKTTLAATLAKRFQIAFFDADDFHSVENKAQMASGKPLTDAMRLPWVTSIQKALNKQAKTGQSCVLAFSGLKKAHRDMLSLSAFRRITLHLTGDEALISQRMRTRSNHFMPASLLRSQFDSLESTDHEDSLITLDASGTKEDVFLLAEAALRKISFPDDTPATNRRE